PPPAPGTVAANGGAPAATRATSTRPVEARPASRETSARPIEARPSRPAPFGAPPARPAAPQGAGERVRHEIVCSACGREATVPFVPRADRPVYCRDCFRRVEGE